MDFSPSIRNRSSVSGKDFFSTEMKSTNFLDYWDEFETEAARNVLQTEVNSGVPFVDTHCHFDFLFKRMGFYESVDDYYEKTFFKVGLKESSIHVLLYILCLIFEFLVLNTP